MEGPPLPPRSPSNSSLSELSNHPSNVTDKRHTLGAEAPGLVYVKSPNLRSKSPDMSNTFNKAPPSPNHRKVQSLHAVSNKEHNEIHQYTSKPKLSVPDICVIGSETSDNDVCHLSSSDDEETVESLYATGKEVKPSRFSPVDLGPDLHTGKRTCEVAALVGAAAHDSDDSSDDKEETVENLYTNNANVKSIMRKKDQGPKYTAVQKFGAPVKQAGQGNEISDVVQNLQQDIGASGTEEGGTKSVGRKPSAGQIDNSIVIESLKGKSIRGVYMNDKGEMCIQFDEQ